MGASKPMKFYSDVSRINTFGQHLNHNLIKKEPMFFNCDFDFAMANGGQITREFLNALPLHWKESPLVFDSRIHMLMPGWYPAIPGWHHDDVPRPSIPVGEHFSTAGQPDYDNLRYESKHILGLLNADVCPTLFVRGNCEMAPVPEGKVVYGQWNAEVEDLIRHEMVEVVKSESGVLYEFDWQTFHTGTKAVKHGWRWFGRVSRNTERVNQVTNEIRVNAQVYLEFPTQGW